VTQDVKKAGVVKCDFSAMLDGDLRVARNPHGQGKVEIGPFRCHMQLSATRLEVEVLHRKIVLAHAEVDVETDTQRSVPANGWN